MRTSIDAVRLKKTLAEQKMTQVELQRRSGISRQTIHSLLEGKTATVREGTLNRLAKALGMPTEMLDKHGVESAYLDRVARQHEFLDFTALGVVNRGDAMSMDRGFIPVSFRERPADGSCTSMAAFAQAQALAMVGAGGNPQDLAALLPTPSTLGQVMERSQRFFLIGDPGSGKTTLLRSIARAYASGKQKQRALPPLGLIPIYVRLASWADQLRTDSKTSVIDAALAQLADPPGPETAEWLKGQCENGNALALLDGLDEVPDPDLRISLFNAIRLFAGSSPKCRIAITSRIVGFDSPPLGERFDTYELQPLTAELIDGFAAEWCAFRHGHDASRKCTACSARHGSVLLAITGDTTIRALAGNPMMLTILLLLYEAGAALPKRRWDLYQRICETFLFCWQEKKRAALSGSPDSQLKLDDREIQWVLESIALQMQKNDWTLVPRWWLSRHVTAFLRDDLGLKHEDAQAESDAVIWSLHARSGLLVERGPERFGFSHLGFQEYYAARAILAAENPVDTLRPYFYHPRWGEVVKLVSAQLDRQRCPQLLRAILDDPDPLGRQAYRGLETVLRCLGAGAIVHDTGLLENLQKEVERLNTSRWVPIKNRIAEILLGLFETRLHELAEKGLNALIRGHGESWEVTAAATSDNDLSLAAAESLSGAIAGGRAEWSAPEIERLGRILVSAANPGESTLQALQQILDLRELRKLGSPREARIIRALSGSLDRIKIMFIFGSCARNEQRSDSDVDLMIIGDATLEDLSPSLAQAEQELARSVNAVVYSADEWRQRCRDHNVFVETVLADKKIFLKGAQDELTAMG